MQLPDQQLTRPFVEASPSRVEPPGDAAIAVALLTDYTVQVAPHVQATRAVLTGERLRYKLRYENAALLFDHGCLVGRIFYKGRFYALPPMAQDEQGRPCFRRLPVAQRPAIAEFCGLPKGILLFYFSLLKQVFGAKTIVGAPLQRSQRFTSPAGNAVDSSVPLPVQPWLDAVGWPYASTVAATSGCSVS